MPVFENLTHEQYRELEGINQTTLKLMDESPAHYVDGLENPREDTPSLGAGRATHCLYFQPELFDQCFVVYPGATRRGKDWDAFEAKHADKTILKQSELEYIHGCVAALRAHDLAVEYRRAGRAELVVQWRDEKTGLLCKARLDWVSESVRGAIVDLKGCSSTHPRIFGAVAARMGYHTQGAFYIRGAKAAGLEVEDFKLLAVETDRPHDVVVYHLGEDELWAGDVKVDALLARVKECRESGKWPGRFQGEQLLKLPLWAYPEGAGEEASIAGLDWDTINN